MNLTKISEIKQSDLHLITLYCPSVIGNLAHGRSIGCCLIPLSFVQALNEYADIWETKLYSKPVEFYFHHSPDEHFEDTEVENIQEHIVSTLQHSSWPMMLCFFSSFKMKKMLGTLSYPNMMYWGQSKDRTHRVFCHIYMDMYGFPRAEILEEKDLFQTN